MYNNEPIDDYIRSVLGYPTTNSMYMDNNQMDYSMVNQQQNRNEDLEDCYPEIYRVVYPMIAKRCSQCNELPSRDLVERMTDEIYSAVEVDNEITLNINLQNETTNTISQTKITNNRNDIKEEIASEPANVREDRSEDRQIRNRGLNDLIKILIIRELLRRPGHRPPRPPHGGNRPPFPGGPRRK